jgi:hypothetical protein
MAPRKRPRIPTKITIIPPAPAIAAASKFEPLSIYLLMALPVKTKIEMGRAKERQALETRSFLHAFIELLDLIATIIETAHNTRKNIRSMKIRITLGSSCIGGWKIIVKIFIPRTARMKPPIIPARRLPWGSFENLVI